MAYITQFKRDQTKALDEDEDDKKRRRVVAKDDPIEISDDDDDEDEDEDVEDEDVEDEDEDEDEDDDDEDEDYEYDDDQEDIYSDDGFNDYYDITKRPVPYTPGQPIVIDVDRYKFQKNLETKVSYRITHALQLEIERRLTSLIRTLFKGEFVPYVSTVNDEQFAQRELSLGFFLNYETNPDDEAREERDNANKLVYSFDLWKSFEKFLQYLQNIVDHGVIFKSKQAFLADYVDKPWPIKSLSIDGITVYSKKVADLNPTEKQDIIKQMRRIYESDEWEFQKTIDPGSRKKGSRKKSADRIRASSTFVDPDDPDDPQEYADGAYKMLEYHLEPEIDNDLRFKLKNGGRDRRYYNIKYSKAQVIERNAYYSIIIHNNHPTKSFFQRFSRNGLKRLAYKLATLKRINVVDISAQGSQMNVIVKKIIVHEKRRRNTTSTIGYTLDDVDKLTPHKLIKALCRKKTQVDGGII